MKLFTKYIPVTALALTAILSAWPASAQGPHGRRGDPQKMAERRVSRLKEALSLTADQETQVRTIFTDQAKQMAELRQKRSTSAEPGRPTPEMRAEMRQMREDTHAKLSKVLDESQMKKFDEMSKPRGRKSRGPGHRNQ